MKTDTIKIFLKMMLIITLLHKIQSKEVCLKHDYEMLCTGITLKSGVHHPDINNNDHTITDITIVLSQISSLPSGFFSDFKHAEVIRLGRIGISVIDSRAFDGMADLKELRLGANEITKILENTFTDLIRLEKLDLVHNKLTEIKKGYFNSLKEMKYLDLSYNKIREIQLGSLDSLINLKSLNLTFNEIKEIKSGIFKSLLNLMELNVNSNKLHTIFRDSFEGLSNLKYLSLYRNYIRQLDVGSFKDLSKLVYLDLGYNSLEKLEPDIFTNLHSLENLKLNHNDLRSLPENSFYTLTKLRSLSINDNKISWFDAEDLLPRLTNLAEVNLNDNTWQCDSLQSIFEAFENHHVKILDPYTEVHTNVYGISCEKTQANTVIITESSQNQPQTEDVITTQVFKQDREKLGNKNASNNVKNAIIIVISVFAAILFLVFALLFVYRRKKINNGKSLSVNFKDVSLLSEFADS